MEGNSDRNDSINVNVEIPRPAETVVEAVNHHYHFNFDAACGEPVSFEQLERITKGIFDTLRRATNGDIAGDHAGPSGVAEDSSSSSSDEGPPTKRAKGRASKNRVKEFLRRNRLAVHSDSEDLSGMEDDADTSQTSRSADKRSAANTVTPRPGLCAKCQSRPPTNILNSMHLYCSVCVKKLSKKRRPCYIALFESQHKLPTF